MLGTTGIARARVRPLLGVDLGPFACWMGVLHRNCTGAGLHGGRDVETYVAFRQSPMGSEGSRGRVRGWMVAGSSGHVPPATEDRSHAR
jgi:hypothetical protein